MMFLNEIQNSTRLVKKLCVISCVLTTAFFCSPRTANAAWQDVTDWKDGSGSGDWNTSNWYNTTQGWDNHNPNYEGYRDLRFNNNNQLSMNNNFSGDGARRWRVTFGSGNTLNRTIGGSTENIFNTFGQGVARIQNDSSGSHTINFPFRMDDNLQINPVWGDLTIGGAVNNNAKNIEVFGNNSKMLTLSGIVSGSGKLIIKENSKVKISSASTYSGNSELDNGELWFATGGSANNSTIWIGNGSALSTTAKVWIESGGTTISSAINVNNGNANTRVLGGLNTSGTATYSGAIGVNNGDLNFEAASGGTVEFTGAVTTSSGKYITKAGSGLVILSGLGNNTSVGANVNSGTLRLAKTSSSSVRALNATPIVNSGGTLQFGGTGGDQLPDNVSITVNSGGRVDMNGVSETVGGVTLNGQGISSGGALVNNNNAAASTLTGAITLGSESWIGGSGSLTIASAIGETGGARNLLKVGSGTLTLQEANTFSGNVIISAGTLSITNANSLGRGDFNFGNGNTLTTLLVNSNTTITNTFRVYNAASNAVVNVVANTTNTISGKLTQDGTDAKTKFGKDGDGTLILNNSTSDFKGQLQVGRGTVILGHSSALGSNSSVNDRGVDLGLNVGDAVTSTDATVLASNTVVVGQSIYVAPTNSNSQRTIGLSGSGTATFNNEIRMEAGSSLTVRAGASSTDQVTISGAITGQNGTTQNLIKSEAGTLVLSGSSANTYGGNTTITSGTLRLAKTAGLDAIASGTIAVNSGGTLLLGAANQIGNSTAITMSGGVLETAGNADTVGKLTVTANSTIVGLNTSSTSSANSFLFSDIDLGAYTTANLGTASGLTLYSSGSPGSYVKYQLGQTINFSSKNNWTDTTSLNNFASKISFDNSEIMAQINFTSGTGITTLSVVAVPEPKVYVAAGALALLIGFAEVRRRKRAKSAV